MAEQSLGQSIVVGGVYEQGLARLTGALVPGGVLDEPLASIDANLTEMREIAHEAPNDAWRQLAADTQPLVDQLRQDCRALGIRGFSLRKSGLAIPNPQCEPDSSLAVPRWLWVGKQQVETARVAHASRGRRDIAGPQDFAQLTLRVMFREASDRVSATRELPWGDTQSTALAPPSQWDRYIF